MTKKPHVVPTRTSSKLYVGKAVPLQAN